jgi:hypothetical protein
MTGIALLIAIINVINLTLKMNLGALIGTLGGKAVEDSKSVSMKEPGEQSTPPDLSIAAQDSTMIGVVIGIPKRQVKPHFRDSLNTKKNQEFQV